MDLFAEISAPLDWIKKNNFGAFMLQYGSGEFEHLEPFNSDFKIYNTLPVIAGYSPTLNVRTLEIDREYRGVAIKIVKFYTVLYGTVDLIVLFPPETPESYPTLFKLEYF